MFGEPDDEDLAAEEQAASLKVSECGPSYRRFVRACLIMPLWTGGCSALLRSDKHTSIIINLNPKKISIE